MYYTVQLFSVVDANFLMELYSSEVITTSQVETMQSKVSEPLCIQDFSYQGKYNLVTTSEYIYLSVNS